jgi:Sec-independent protein translocase protein TatA
VGGLDPAKIFLLLVIALIVVGPERLPGAARQLGGAWRELNRLRAKFEEEVHALVPDLDLPNIPMNPTKAVTGYITSLVTGTGESTATTTAISAAASEVGDSFTSETFTPTGNTWAGRGSEQAESTFRPLLGSTDPTLARRPASVPSWSAPGGLSIETRSADTVFVFDEPSMN